MLLLYWWCCFLIPVFRANWHKMVYYTSTKNKWVIVAQCLFHLYYSYIAVRCAEMYDISFLSMTHTFSSLFILVILIQGCLVYKMFYNTSLDCINCQPSSHCTQTAICQIAQLLTQHHSICSVCNFGFTFDEVSLFLIKFLLSPNLPILIFDNFDLILILK